MWSGIICDTGPISPIVVWESGTLVEVKDPHISLWSEAGTTAQGSLDNFDVTLTHTPASGPETSALDCRSAPDICDSHESSQLQFSCNRVAGKKSTGLLFQGYLLLTILTNNRLFMTACAHQVFLPSMESRHRPETSNSQ